MTTDDLAVRVRGLTMRYGDHVAVDGIDLDVRRGETFALLGPNGAGKTTTVSILATLLTADSGAARPSSSSASAWPTPSASRPSSSPAACAASSTWP